MKKNLYGQPTALDKADIGPPLPIDSPLVEYQQSAESAHKTFPAISPSSSLSSKYTQQTDININKPTLGRFTGLSEILKGPYAEEMRTTDLVRVSVSWMLMIATVGLCIWMVVKMEHIGTRLEQITMPAPVKAGSSGIPPPSTRGDSESHIMSNVVVTPSASLAPPPPPPTPSTKHMLTPSLQPDTTRVMTRTLSPPVKISLTTDIAEKHVPDLTARQEAVDWSANCEESKTITVTITTTITVTIAGWRSSLSTLPQSSSRPGFSNPVSSQSQIPMHSASRSEAKVTGSTQNTVLMTTHTGSQANVTSIAPSSLAFSNAAARRCVAPLAWLPSAALLWRHVSS